jgi:mxaA protein
MMGKNLVGANLFALSGPHSGRTSSPLQPLLALIAALHGTDVGAEAPNPVHEISATLSRDFGIVMGDTFREDIRVQLEPGFALETALLLLPDSAVNDYLEVRATDWNQVDGNVYQVSLTYQVFKGVREPEALTVPAVPLYFRRGAEVIEAAAPARQLTLMPLIPAGTPDEKVTLRDALPPLPISDSRRPALLALGLLILAALSLGAAWLLNHPQQAAPFRSAAKALRKLRHQPQNAETLKTALKQVHEAFNQTAGHTLFRNGLAEFMARHPEFTDATEEAEQFFAYSERVFFAPANLALPSDYSLSRLKDLCEAMASTEKGPQ